MCLLQVLGFVSYMLTCTGCEFLLILGSYDPILCTLYSNKKILMCAQIMGSFSSFFRTLLCAYHNIFVLVACRIIGLVGSIDILWLLASIDIFWMLDCVCVSLCYVFVAYHSLAIFVPQYSLYSSNYLPLDMSMAFHYLVEKYTIYGGARFILAF